jgi:cold shock CspA family protein/ribosome-associated translation inhibitor RaiA
MNTSLQIAFHNVPHSQAIESAVREAAARLEAHRGRITCCRVVIDQPHRHHEEGNLFQVRIDLKMPGTELVVKRDISGDLARGDLLAAILEIFDEMQRRMDEFVNCRRGFVKIHEGPAHARVTRLFPEAGYGFLETSEGREIFFHENSVLNSGFKHLSVGTEVSFVEELGEKGAQASTVRLVGRHHHVL